MSRFIKIATGLRDFGSDINANISKALNISKATNNPNKILLEESRAGRLHGIEAVLDQFRGAVDVNGALDRDFMSPLCLACAGGHEDAALLLIHAGADPNNAGGAVAAAAAAGGRCKAFARGESENESSVCAAPSPPLLLAVEAGLARAVRELIACGARVDIPRAGDGWNALHICASQGNALIMSDLLNAPLANSGARTARLETPLSIACSRGHLSVVDLLLRDEDEDHGVKGDIRKNDGDDWQDKRTDDEQEGRPDNRGDDDNNQSVGDDAAFAPITAVAAANRRGHHHQGEERTWAGRTPLHRGAQNGHTEVVLRLLVHGVSVDPADKDGVTPLMLAARGGHWSTARELVRKGKASVTAATDNGDTALHIAAAAGGRVRYAKRVVKMLLQAGADVDAQNVHGSTALHLAAAIGAYDSLLPLLSAGANPTTANSCGLSPGSFFLEPSHGASRSEESREEIRRMLRERRERKGHLRRLADSSAKRKMIAAVASRAVAFVHGSVEFALKTQRWDLDAREPRTRLRRLGKFHADILSDPARVAPGSGANERDGDPRPFEPYVEARTPPPLLLDLSPEREGRAARAVKNRRAAAAEAVKGASIALKDLEDWQRCVLAERAAVTSFLKNADPAQAFAVGNNHGGSDCEDDEEGASLIGVDAFGGSWSFLSAEAFERGESGRRDSWSGATGASPDRSEDLGDFRGERGGPIGFVSALAALDPCVGAIRKATSAAMFGDHLSAAFEMLREHVKSTLIDLMDLETSIPAEGEGVHGDVDVCSEDEDGERGTVGTGATLSTSFTPDEAAVLDSKIGGLLDRLSGSTADDVNGDDESNQSNDRGRRSGANVGSGGYRSGRRLSHGTHSLATVYAKGLGDMATLAEAEVETAERLTAIAMRMVVGAVAGPLLRALDDAYQRLTRADRDVRRMLPEAEALLEGPGSEEERMRESRSRLVTIRQQVVDEEDFLEELVSKLRRRKRQAAGNEEIGAIMEERLQVRARHAALRSVKLSELKALRQSGAYQRFPELLLEHPNRAEIAFRSLLVGGIAVRDPDEWTEHHMASLLPMHAGGSGIVDGGGGGDRASLAGGGDIILDGIGGNRCRLAEIDGSAVALVEVDCRDREAERSLVASLLRFAPLERHQSSSGTSLRATCFKTTPELAVVTGVALDEDRALLEVPVEGTLTAKAWLCTGAVSTGASRAVAVAEAGYLQSAFSVGVQDLAQALNLRERQEPGVTRAPKPEAEPQLKPDLKGEPLEARRSCPEVWAVMVQALRGLVSVHAVSEESTHGAVCLSNILVAARSTQQAEVKAAACPENAAGIPYPIATQMVEVETKGTAASRAGWSTSSMQNSTRMRGFRRAQLAPPFPAALAQPPTEYVAPEVVRGQPFRQPADVYAFGIALRAAFCGGHEEATYYSESGSKNGGGVSVSTGTRSVLPPGRGPADGPLRLALTEVLEKMLEEDESRRCTALEALMSDFLRVPPGESPKLYPSTWSTFPAIHRGISSTTPGNHSHWVAAALSAGRKDMVGEGRRWWESCFAVDVPTSQVGSMSGGETANGERGETAEIETMFRRSLPGARIHRLVRLQDRGRWLRFVCERDGAISSVSAAASAASPNDIEDGTAINVPPVARFFADPRDVVSLKALFTIAAPAAPTSMAAKIGGRIVATTMSEEDEDLEVDDAAAADHFSRKGAASVRCTKEARFAAVAFALPPGGGEEVELKGGEEVYENIRTVAIIRAVTGVSDEQCGVGDRGVKGLVPFKTSALSPAAGTGGLVMPTPSTGKREGDPFLGVEPSIDDLTRVGGISILSSGSTSGLVDGSSSNSTAAAKNGTPVALLPFSVGLSSHAVNSIKTYESLGTGAGHGQARSPGFVGTCRDDGATTTVFTVRREACYPEYLATFSFPPHAA